MGTYVSMLNWTAAPPPDAGDIRASVRRRHAELKRHGLHSVTVLPDACDCTAVMIANVTDEAEAVALAATIYPDASVHVESMRFDDDPAAPNWIGETITPPKPRDYLDAVLEAVTAT